MPVGLALGAAGVGDSYAWHDTLRGFVNADTLARVVADDPRWGAVGDDSTENRAAFAAIMAALPTSAPRKGAELLIPPGIFRVSQSSAFAPCIAASKPALTIRGVNPEASVLKHTGSTAGGVIEANGVDNLLIENLTIDQGYPTRTAVGGGIDLLNVKHAVIRNVHFKNMSEAAVSLYRCEDVTIENCWADNLGLGFVRIQDPGAGGATRRVWMDNNDILNWQIKESGGHAALQLHGTTTGTIEEIYMRGNQLTSTRTSGLIVGIGSDYGKQVRILDNRIKFGGVGEGIAATGDNYDISDNHISDGQVAGIVLWPESFALNRRFNIHRNHIWNQGQGIAVVFKANNQFWDDLDVAFNHSYDAFTRDGIGSSGRQSFGFQTYHDSGTYTGCGFRRCVLHDNYLYGNVNGPYNLISDVSPQWITERNWITVNTRD